MDEEIIILEEEIETIEEIDIEEVEYATGTSGNRHNALDDRNEADAHSISSITGLEKKLADIESLKTVYSDKIGVANYYQWANGVKRDEFGYFVSLVPETTTIDICQGKDIFGVTVSKSEVGFIGGQNADGRDNTYALVATTGLVDVRCESGLIAGDYVVSDGGIAKKTTSECGYKVIATVTKDGVEYAVISLGVQACTTDALGQRVKQLETDMDYAEINIAEAVRLATEACAMAGTSNTTSGETKETVDNVVGAVDRIQGEMDSTREDLDKSKVDINKAILAAETTAQQAVDIANSSLANINGLVEKFEPIDEWVDPETGQVGAEYIVKYMDKNGLSTKAEVQVVESLTEYNKSAIEHNANSINMMVSSVDKYSVGEYSQAYGLTLEQARSILKDGMIYIPTKHGNVETHTESYIYNETEKLEKDFTEGFYYIWGVQPDGEFMWSEKIGSVWVNKEHPPAGDAYTYWYDGDKLYLLNDGEWTEVATLAGNVNNRITSMIRQEVDDIAIEITTTQGSVASVKAELDETQSSVQQLSKWKTEEEEKMASVRTVADDDGASVVISALQKNGDVVEEMASLVLNVVDDEEGQSYLQMSADNINLTGANIELEGYVTFERLNTTETDENGTTKTIIDGGNIITGTITSDAINTKAIKSKRYIGPPDDNTTPYSQVGTFLDLDTGNFTSPTFAVDAENEKAYFKGSVDINEDSNIAGWDVTSEGLSNSSITTDVSTGKQRIYTTSVWTGHKPHPSASADMKFFVEDYNEIDPQTKTAESPMQTFTLDALNGQAEKITTINKEITVNIPSTGLEDALIYYLELDSIIGEIVSVDLNCGSVGNIATVSHRYDSQAVYLTVDFISGREQECTDVVYMTIEYKYMADVTYGTASVSYKPDSNLLVESANVKKLIIANSDYTEYGNQNFAISEDGTLTLNIQLEDTYGLSGFVIFEYNCAITTSYPFAVLEDGSVYATKGKIADWTLDESGLGGEYAGLKMINSTNKYRVFWVGDPNNDELQTHIDSTGHIYTPSLGVKNIVSDNESINDKLQVGDWFSVDQTNVSLSDNDHPGVKMGYHRYCDAMVMYSTGRIGLFGSYEATSNNCPYVYLDKKVLGSNQTTTYYDHSITAKLDLNNKQILVSCDPPPTDSCQFFELRIYFGYEDASFFNLDTHHERLITINTNKDYTIDLSNISDGIICFSEYYISFDGKQEFDQNAELKIDTAKTHRQTSITTGEGSISGFFSKGAILPDTAGNYTIGQDNWRWYKVYTCDVEAVNVNATSLRGTLYGTIGDESDIRLKNSITSLTEQDKYSMLFDKLDPKSFKFNKDDSKVRLGFIAQDIYKAMDESGFSEEEKNGIYYENNDYAGLFYMEFLPLNIHETQKLKARVTELERQIKELKGE